MIQRNLLNRNRLTDSQRMNLWLLGKKDRGRDSQGMWDGHGHTAVFNMENQQGPAGQHRNSAQYSVITLWFPGGR